MIVRRIFCSRSVERLLHVAMAPQRRSLRLQATTSSSSTPLSAVKKETAAAGKKKKTIATTTKASALAPALAPSTSTTRATGKAVAVKKEKAPAPAAPAPASAAAASNKRAPPKKTAAAASKAKKTTSGGPTREMEQQLWRQGFSFVVGVDEAGRGPLAGPVVAAAAVLPRDGTGLPAHIRLDDSKKMSSARRPSRPSSWPRETRRGPASPLRPASFPRS